MLRLLGTEGRDGITKLRGIFAFALWNRRERQLILGRDAWERSLSISRKTRSCSGLRTTGGTGFNPAAIASVAWNGFVVSPDAMIRGISPVEAGQLLSFGIDGRNQGENYFWSSGERNRAACEWTSGGNINFRGQHHWPSRARYQSYPICHSLGFSENHLFSF